MKVPSIMSKFGLRLASLSVITLFSLILVQVVSTQSNPDNTESQSEHILFIRDDSSSVTFNVNTGKLRQLTPDRYYGQRWSPDGKRILGLQIDENPFNPFKLFVMDADGQNLLLLTDPSQFNIVSHSEVWSPDSQRIFFVARDRQADASLAIYSMPANGGSIHRLTELSSVYRGLDVSPDGSQIMFSSHGYKLYTIASEGGTPKLIDIPLKIANFTLSPDGSQIAAVSFSPEKQIGLYVMKVDGSDIRLLVTDMMEIHALGWSPDGTEQLFYGDGIRGRKTTIGIVNVNTGKVDTYDVGEGVLESINLIRTATWSRDGKQIVISGVYTEDNPYNIHASLYLVDRRFTQIRRLTYGTHLDDVVQWRP